jgi:putative transposase
MARIHRLCRHLSKLITKRTTYHGPKRSRKRNAMKKAEYRVRDRIHNLIDDCHWRAIRFLTLNYRVIIIPHFNTPQMTKRSGRSVGRATVKGILNWGHGRFRTRLVEKARECPWVKVIISTEEFTSKTCGKCGKRYEIGSDKEYKCRNQECLMKMDRDWNGARNILLKYLTERRIVA